MIIFVVYPYTKLYTNNIDNQNFRRMEEIE